MNLARVREYARDFPCVALVVAGKRFKARARRMRGYSIVEGADAVRLGLGEGAVLLVCEEVIGPERIADAVRVAGLNGERLLGALPHVLCVASRAGVWVRDGVQI